MKNLIIALFGIFLFANSCTSQVYIENGLLNKIVAQQEFTFVAERANITNGDVINAINAIPGASSARLQELGYGYDIVFENKEMKVHLPYFGTTYNPSLSRDEIGFNFTSKDFTIESKDGKKSGKTLTIRPNDIKYINAIYIEISSSGKAFVSINANDRQPISFSGYIKKNDLKKEK